MPQQQQPRRPEQRATAEPARPAEETEEQRTKRPHASGRAEPQPTDPNWIRPYLLSDPGGWPPVDPEVHAGGPPPEVIPESGNKD